MKFFHLAVIAVLFISEPLMADKKKVLIIESYHQSFAWDASYREGITEALGDDYTIEYYEMDTKRVPANEFEHRANQAWSRYQLTQPDLVILGDDNALKYLGKRFEKTNTPVVFLGINNNPRRYITIGKNITGILERPLLKKSTATIKDIIPNCKKLLILFDNSTTSQVILDEEFRGNSSMTLAGIQTDLKLIDSYSQWQTETELGKGKYDAIIIGLYFTLKDKEGKSVSGDDVLNWTSKNSSVPVFAFWDFAVGENKAIGGLVLYGKTQGIAAGEIAKEILNGKEVQKINPKVGEKGRYFFSKKGLERHHLVLPSYITRGIEYTD